MRPHYISERCHWLDMPRIMNAQHKKGYLFIQAIKDGCSVILIFEDCQILKQTPDRFFVLEGNERSEGED